MQVQFGIPKPHMNGIEKNPQLLAQFNSKIVRNVRYYANATWYYCSRWVVNVFGSRHKDKNYFTFLLVIEIYIRGEIF